ncbi:trans-sulfuration enzyme family protein [Oryzihumus leptocrescens]|uniref:trans-sulfuration enzyme family protein n=1 Tax=Oryzihumus leptocrescens TaxID=297536 RepID=UPI00114DE067|nr:PLP-dependent transferase [Oryzihumus leptocrescens]
MDATHPDDLAPASLLVSAGRPPRVPGAGVNAPLELTSTYVADGEVNYARAGNPTWTAFEDALGALEGGTALVFASGMAAVAAALSLAPERGVVVAPTHAYNGTGSILGDLADAGRLEVRRVDISDTAAVVAALDGADLLWVESPTNPMLEVADVPALVAAAHERGAVVVCDNTFATPLVQQPLADGADVVMHSVTKFLSGHSDVVLGATVTAPTGRGRALQDRLAHHRLIHGAIAGPVETWLALRGMRTMHLRVERATANAAVLAERLGGHPAVERVRYPGFGAVVSIEVCGGAEAAERVSAAVRLWTHATSLGGVESLVERRRRISTEPLTVPENLLRLSVGVEDVEDLWRDLDRALRQA